MQAIQFSLNTQFRSIWPIDRTLSGATTTGQSGPGSDRIEGVHRISQSSSITGASPSDCLVSYPDSRCGRLTPLLRCSRCIRLGDRSFNYKLIIIIIIIIIIIRESIRRMFFKMKICFSEFFFLKYKLCMVWNWFIEI